MDSDFFATGPGERGKAGILIGERDEEMATNRSKNGLTTPICP
jgi:hypothetical protein